MTCGFYHLLEKIFVGSFWQPLSAKNQVGIGVNIYSSEWGFWGFFVVWLGWLNCDASTVFLDGIISKHFNKKWDIWISPQMTSCSLCQLIVLLVVVHMCMAIVCTFLWLFLLLIWPLFVVLLAFFSLLAYRLSRLGCKSFLLMFLC